jgi:hypothetical protein
MKGLILTGVISDAGGAERNGKWDSNLPRIVVSRPLGEDEGLGTAPDFSDGGLRLRGMGGGMMGRPSYTCVNSVSMGIGVVRALGGELSSIIAAVWCVLDRMRLT